MDKYLPENTYICCSEKFTNLGYDWSTLNDILPGSNARMHQLTYLDFRCHVATHIRSGDSPHLSLLEIPVGGYEAIERINGEMLRIAKENAGVKVRRPTRIQLAQAPAPAPALENEADALLMSGQEAAVLDHGSSNDYSSGNIEEWPVESDQEDTGDNMYLTDHEASDENDK
jgi:hypothetical protein